SKVSGIGPNPRSSSPQSRVAPFPNPRQANRHNLAWSIERFFSLKSHIHIRHIFFRNRRQKRAYPPPIGDSVLKRGLERWASPFPLSGPIDKDYRNPKRVGPLPLP